MARSLPPTSSICDSALMRRREISVGAPAAFSRMKFLAYSPVWMSVRHWRMAFFVSSVTMRGPVTYSPYSALLEIERSEEHTSELQSLMRISYAVFCLKKNINIKHNKFICNTKNYKKKKILYYINLKTNINQYYYNKAKQITAEPQSNAQSYIMKMRSQGNRLSE